jgi:hypothetical protein
MGKWKRQYLTIEPGERDVQDVAGDLRASFASIELDGISHPEQLVTIEADRVHWDSGQSHARSTFELVDKIAKELNVRCDWLVEQFHHEVESTGGAALYTWVDGELRLVEKAGPLPFLRGEFCLETLEQQWGIDVETPP